jgi:tRNA (mo5U34)-methyltransferase
VTASESDRVVDTSLAAEVAETSWYHTIELPDGTVTSGNFDTLRERDHLPLPESLTGKRCLDVGTSDGFWAFEMERRGAAEVVAVDVPDRADLDWPAVVNDEEWRRVERIGEHRGFQIAKRALGSRVKLLERPVYELQPDEVGQFDFAFAGSLLLHLRDPVGALIAVRRVLRGEILSADTVSPLLTLMHPRQPVARLEAPGWPLWWLVNLAGYRRLFEVSGYEVERVGRPFLLKPAANYTNTARSRRPLYGRLQRTLVTRFGILHSWILARPSTA